MHDLHAICRAGVFKETLRVERRGAGEQIAELPCGTVVGKSRSSPQAARPRACTSSKVRFSLGAHASSERVASVGVSPWCGPERSRRSGSGSRLRGLDLSTARARRRRS
jgi:hypothetical protein